MWFHLSPVFKVTLCQILSILRCSISPCIGGMKRKLHVFNPDNLSCPFCSPPGWRTGLRMWRWVYLWWTWLENRFNRAICMTVLLFVFLVSCSCQTLNLPLIFLRVVAFPIIRWLHRTSAATRGSSWEPSQHGPDRGSSTSGSCSDWEPFACFHWPGKQVTIGSVCILYS